MIEPTHAGHDCAPWGHAQRGQCASPPPCFTPWVFMEFRDLFGDGSKEGHFQRIGCLHEVLPDGSCPSCPSGSRARCWLSRTDRKVVRIAPEDANLPRGEIRSILQAGDEITLQFESGTSPADQVLRAISHVLRKLRNTGIQIVVSGLSTSDRSKLNRMEWEHS